MEDSDSESNAEESSAMSSDEEWQPRLHPNDWRYAARKYAVTKPNKKGKQTEVDFAKLKTVYGEGYVTSAVCTSCENDYEKKTARLQEVHSSLVYYAAETSMCDDCKKATWLH